MRLPLSSLRANLIAAFLAVIAVSLLLASTAFAYLLREYQVERETDRLGNIAAVYMAQVVRMARSGATLQVISGQLDQSADDSDLRVLLLDDHGQVLHDTDNNRFVAALASEVFVAYADEHFERLGRTASDPTWRNSSRTARC